MARDVVSGGGNGPAAPLTSLWPNIVLLPLWQIDPLDPLLQLLVQDRGFIAAVQGSQLHAAAATAVKLLRAHFAATEFRRPADRAGAHDLGGGVTPRGGGGRGAPLAPQRPLDARQREAVRTLKAEALQLEDVVPWDCVRRTWRGRRTNWRRQLQAGETFQELAARLRELRSVLLVEDGAWAGCGPSWQAQLDACVQGRGSCALLVAVWDELRGTVWAWLGGRHGPAITPAQVQAGVSRAMAAMQAAARAGDADALLQVPLEAIVCGDVGGLAAVRQAIDAERRAVAARLAAGGAKAGAAGRPLAAAQFAALDTVKTEFDSGAESMDEDEGGDATDLEDNGNF